VKGRWCDVEAKSARRMPLEYEMMGRTDRRNTRCRVTWLSSQSRSFQNPARDVQSQVSWTLVKRPRGVMRRTALQTKPRWDCRPGPVQKDKNTTSPRNPGTSNKRNRVVGGRENKIQLVGREMKCKNNRWEEGQRRRELQSEFTIG
jgi:hypothetical protein